MSTNQLNMRVDALNRLSKATQDRGEAKEAYREAIKLCVQQGVSNQAMADRAGVSETAIRLYRKRNGL